MKNELCWQSQASCQAVPIKTCQKREWTQGGEKARSENGRSWERGPVFSTEPLRRAVGSRGVRSLLMVPDFPECLADSTPSFSFWWWVSLMIKFMCSIFLSVESAGPKMLSLTIEIKCQMDLGQTTWDSWEGNLFISVMINVLRLPIVLGEMKLLVFTFWLFDFGTLNRHN